MATSPSAQGRLQQCAASGSALLKALLASSQRTAGWKGAACSLGLAVLGLFPAGAQARPEPCINTHPSLNLGCLTRDQWDRKIQEWTEDYRRKLEEKESKLWNVDIGLLHSVMGEQSALLGRTINRDRAYAHVKALMGENAKPGQGVTIAILDTAVYPLHPWFTGTQITNVNMRSPFPDALIHGMHGMQVASAAVGRYGVAPGANLLVLGNSGLPSNNMGKYTFDEYQAREYNQLLSYNADILSISEGGGGTKNIEEAVTGGGFKENVRKEIRKTINVLAQKNAKEKTIIVWAAGNERYLRGFLPTPMVCAHIAIEDGGPRRCLNPDERGMGSYNASSPQFMAGLPALAPELRGHYIAAVAALGYNIRGEQQGMKHYSNYCGIAADWCIAAPVGLPMPKFDAYVDEEGNEYIRSKDTISGGKVINRLERQGAKTRDEALSNGKIYDLKRDENGHFFAEVYTGVTGDVPLFDYNVTIKDFLRDENRHLIATSDGTRKKIGVRSGTAVSSGTSIAAPMVAGSLAVMKSLFRNQLSNTELVTRLFATADKTGIYANRAIYGQGLLDLGAATNPWGMVGLMGPGQSVGAQAQGQGQQDSPGEADGELEPSEANACGKGTIKTHASLELGCLTQAEWNNKVQEWATAYRAVPGFAKQWGLAAVNADRAYGHLKAVQGEGLKPGQGVTIGFVDSGMDPGHPSFAASKVEQKLMRGATSANRSHGTAVASVAAGGRISSGPHQSKAHHGVAWGADVAMFAIPAEVYPVTRAVHPIKDYAATQNDAGEWIPKPNKEMVGLFARDKADAKFFKSVLSEDIDILNLSFPSAPFPGTIDDYKKSRLQRNYRKTVAALAQKGKEEKTILVWSAGDVDPSRSQTPGSSPQMMAGLPARIEELRGHSIAVVATKQDGAIADFSNRCGRAAQWCIAAPGQNVHVASSGTQGWSTLSSTSVAAPMVSGGLAVMKQLFRDQLSNTELVSRLFSTAKKTGIHADSSIYGQGLMDLGAATNPWGMAAFMGTGQAVGGQSRGDSVGGQGGGVELSSTSLSLGSAMGDGLSEALAQQEIAAFDSLGAPFWFSAGSFTLPAEGPSLAARLQQFLAPTVEPTTPEKWQVDFQSGAPALEAGHLALTHGADRLSFHGPQGLSATLFQRPADYDQAPLAGVALSWNPQALPALSLAAGYLHEQEELLGSQGSGAFGELSGHTLFLSTELDTTTPQGWELSAQGEVGIVNPAVARSQFISDISTLTSSAFRLQVRKPLENGAAFRLALSQPLRVESGAAALSLPTGRTKDGLVVGTDLNAPLSPSGRQLDLTAQVDLPLLGGELSLAATHSRQPQHQKGADHQWTFFTGYRATW